MNTIKKLLKEKFFCSNRFKQKYLLHTVCKCCRLATYCMTSSKFGILYSIYFASPKGEHNILNTRFADRLYLCSPSKSKNSAFCGNLRSRGRTYRSTLNTVSTSCIQHHPGLILGRQPRQATTLFLIFFLSHLIGTSSHDWLKLQNTQARSAERLLLQVYLW